MTTLIDWPSEFGHILSCDRCDATTYSHLLRDDEQNIPQPGRIGRNYFKSRVLFVGRNPATPKALAPVDCQHTETFRSLRDEQTTSRYESLITQMGDFMPMWPIVNQHFPLEECGLSLEDIAYCNVVRCRTSGDRPPGIKVTRNCVTEHFHRWVKLLDPLVVVFIGKWAHDQANSVLTEYGVPSTYVNCKRGLSMFERVTNRREVAALVKMYRD